MVLVRHLLGVLASAPTLNYFALDATDADGAGSPLRDTLPELAPVGPGASGRHINAFPDPDPKASKFVREQKRLIKQRQVAVLRARSEWAQSAGVLRGSQTSGERDKLSEMLKQVRHARITSARSVVFELEYRANGQSCALLQHHMYACPHAWLRAQVHKVLEAQARRLNKDVRRLERIRVSLQGTGEGAQACARSLDRIHGHSKRLPSAAAALRYRPLHRCATLSIGQILGPLRSHLAFDLAARTSWRNAALRRFRTHALKYEISGAGGMQRARFHQMRIEEKAL